MKTLFLTVFLVALSFFSTNASNSMLFPQYEEGYAILRSGGRAVAQFNYNKLEQQMLFVDNNGRSMILDPNSVVLVVVGERTFVPAGSNDAFNERISVGDNVFFVRHRVNASTGRATVFGAEVESQRASTTTSCSFVRDGTEFRFLHRVTAADEHLSDESAIFIHDGSRFVQINSLRNLTRQFNRTQRAQIEDFARRNNISFRNIENVKAITVYALSL